MGRDYDILSISWLKSASVLICILKLPSIHPNVSICHENTLFYFQFTNSKIEECPEAPMNRDLRQDLSTIFKVEDDPGS